MTQTIQNNQSVITKADLLKSEPLHKSGMFKVMGINKTIAEQRNAGNLFVQGYTGVNPVIGNINSVVIF